MNSSPTCQLPNTNLVKTESLIHKLSKLTSANIAASSTATGNTALGRDWRLDYIIGQITATLPLLPECTLKYNGILGNGPGGVGTNDGTSSLQWWLRADQGVTTSGSSVTDWTDQSGKALNMTQADATKQPTLTTTAINGQPAVTFDGITQMLTSSALSSTFPTTASSLFTVANTKAAKGIFIRNTANGSGTNLYNVNIPYDDNYVYWE